MIALAAGVRVYLACGVTDMRKGMTGLAMLVQQAWAHRRRWRQLYCRKPRPWPGGDRACNAHHLLPPSVELACADPVLAGNLGRRQLRPEALAHDLALLLRRPNPPARATGDHLDRRSARTPTTCRMSVPSSGTR